MSQSFVANRNRQILIIILATSVCLRVASALYLGNQVVDLPGTADQVSYNTLALRVLGGHGFTFDKNWWPLTLAGAPTAHWSYLYTFYLVAVYALAGPNPLVARLIQAVLVGLAQPYLTYLITARVFAPRSSQAPSRLDRLPLLAAGISAVYIYFVYYAANLMTEPFYITAILAALYAAMILNERISQRAPGTLRISAALGLLLAAAVLLRQLFLGFVPFLFLWLAFAAYRHKAWKNFITSSFVVAAIIVAAIVPATIFNYARFGRFVLLNTNAGFAFYWANHPIHGVNFIEILPPNGPTYQDLIPAELQSLDEAALDQALLKRGVQFVLDDPVRYALLSLSRVKSYFKFWPESGSGVISNISRVGSFGIFFPFMLYGLALSFVHRSLKHAWLLYLFIVIYTGIHVLSWALVRYRLPVDGVLITFAAYGLADLWTRVETAFAARQLNARHST